MENIFDFYKGKRVFLTGHTGFKGSWMCKMLANAGAIVTGYSLEAPTEPSLFKIANIESDVHSVIGDIRDMAALKKAFDDAQPEIVLHLAAQPIVRDSYKDPAYTYETNVMGTVNILECVRQNNCVKSFLNVTTDKVYLNKEWNWGYREIEELDGYDPYSNSKSCSELVTHSYKRSFFTDKNGQPIVPISTARAGNVIGGGDFANDRIIPDSIRAAAKHEVIIVRNPFSTRPYQHVLEPLYAYLVIAMKQYEDSKYADLVKKMLPNGTCGVVSFGIKGGRSAAEIQARRYPRTSENHQRAHAADPAGPIQEAVLRLDMEMDKTHKRGLLSKHRAADSRPYTANRFPW